MDDRASRRGRNNRRKGGSFEREVAERLRAVWPGAKRTIGQARTGAEAPDIEGTPFWIETGTGSSVTGLKKLEQATADHAAWVERVERIAGSDGVGIKEIDALIEAIFTGGVGGEVAITHKPRGEVIVTMTLDAWLQLAKKAYGGQP